ncbi:hypothetical protein GCK32_007108, partial [Trichostrongylus colubriformis]
ELEVEKRRSLDTLDPLKASKSDVAIEKSKAAESRPTQPSPISESPKVVKSENESVRQRVDLTQPEPYDEVSITTTSPHSRGNLTSDSANVKSQRTQVSTQGDVEDETLDITKRREFVDTPFGSAARVDSDDKVESLMTTARRRSETRI